MKVDRGDRVTDLVLRNNGLVGEIPPEIGQMANLAHLLLYKNQLSGGIPAELADLTNLAVLDLVDNDLAGDIPPELGELTQLEDLNLGLNRLSGEIPPEIGNISSLTQLLLNENQLRGGLPAELANLHNLVVLDLMDNDLTGEVPPEFGVLSRLEYLNLAMNQLDGELPAELGDLSNLQELVLFKNRFQGQVPRELSELSNLFNLRLDFNRLNGEIPPELGRLSNLTGLDLLDNQLTGEVPHELTELENLRTLFLSRNPNLTGCMPDDLLDIENNDFEQLDLQPCAVLELGVLAELFAAMGGDGWTKSDGWLSDAPFEQWHGVNTDMHGRVTSLVLTDNGLSGVIPKVLSRLTRLHQLRLGGNQVAGCIPRTLLTVADNDFDILGVPECPKPVTLEDVSALPWYADGLDEDEQWAVNSLKSFIGSENDLDRRPRQAIVRRGVVYRRHKLGRIVDDRRVGRRRSQLPPGATSDRRVQVGLRRTTCAGRNGTPSPVFATRSCSIPVRASFWSSMSGSTTVSVFPRTGRSPPLETWLSSTWGWTAG